MGGKQVLIIGLGLIGGSIGRAIKAKHPACYIVGYDVDQEEARRAHSWGIIDETATCIADQTEDADFIVIATPVSKTEEIMDHLMRHCFFKENVIITDVGSTKQTIMNKAEHFPETVTFIGGHPLAGSDKSGVRAASRHLFEQSYFVLIPERGADEGKMDVLKQLYSGTGAMFMTMTAEAHDRITGMISHFPHIIAAGLVHMLSDRNEDEPVDLTQLAAGGFRDITRIASSSPRMWHDILLANRSELMDLMDTWLTEMKHVQTMLQNTDSEGIYHYFKQAKQHRDNM